MKSWRGMVKLFQDIVLLLMELRSRVTMIKIECIVDGNCVTALVIA